MIMTDSVVAAALAAAGTENNPVIGALGVQATASSVTTTGGGSEIQPAINVVTGTTYDFWEATPNASDRTTVQFIFPAPVTLDFAAIAAHNVGTIGGDVRVQYSTDAGVTWVGSGAGIAVPTDDAAIGFRFQSVAADYWRVRYNNAGGKNVRTGVILLGTELVVPSRIYQGYVPPLTPTQVDLQSNVSEGGHLLGSSVVRRSSSATASLRNLPASFIRGATWKNFQRAFNDGAGFFWGWRPKKYGDLHYAWRAGSPIVPENAGPTDHMAVNMGMRFYDDA